MSCHGGTTQSGLLWSATGAVALHARSTVRVAAVILLLAVCARSLGQTRPADTLPTQHELAELYRAERYQEAIRHIVRILPIKGERGTAYDRHELLRLKAECHLRLGDVRLAARTFDEAAAAAPEEAEAATDRATAMLLLRSKRDGYTPKTGSLAGEVLAVNEPDGRTLAVKALYADEQVAAQKVIDRSRSSNSIDELCDAAGTLAPLRTLELAATGGEDQTRELLESTARRAMELAEKQRKGFSTRIDELDRAANRKRKMGSAYRKRGLAAEEMSELRDIIAMLIRIDARAKRLEELVPWNASDLEVLRQQVRETATRADQVLRADYSGVYDRS